MIVNDIEMDDVASMAEVLALRVSRTPDAKAFTFLNDGKSNETILTYREIDSCARNLAAEICQRSQIGDRVLIVAPNGLEYIKGLFACFYAQVIAVPVYPPANRVLAERFLSIVKNSKPTLALTSKKELSDILAGNIGVVENGQVIANQLGLNHSFWLEIEKYSLQKAEKFHPKYPSSDQVALLQYTSGSTGDPKGVILSHRNLMANEKIICEVFCHDKNSIGVGWLPFHHDMGLIGNLLQTVYVGMHTVLMDTYHFVREPLNWLRAISHYRATTSGGPNFAYELVARRLAGAKNTSLDLSTWKLAFCGAEPIRPETFEYFIRQTTEFGFSGSSLSPCYGLAEATLMVSGSRIGEGATILSVGEPELQSNRVERAENVESISIASTIEFKHSANTRQIVSCGNQFPYQTVLIVKEKALEVCDDNQIGEICIAGENVTTGYWNNEDATQQSFDTVLDASTNQHLRVFRTGDLGFKSNGHLYVSGRLKDLIIINGRNYFPQDIENFVASISTAFRFGGGACFSLDVNGQERLVIVQEVGRTLEQNPGDLSRNIVDKILLEYHLRPYAVVLIKRGTIPKTTSGKIRRNECKLQYLQQALRVVYESVPETDNFGEDIISNSELIVSEREVSSETQEKLIEIVAAVHNVSIEKASSITNLTQLGIDSIQLIRIKYEIEQAFNVDLDIEKILTSRTYADLVSQIFTKKTLNGDSFEKKNSQAYEVIASELFPLSSGQKSLWYLQSINPNSSIYNIVRSFDIAPAIKQDRIEAILLELVSCHPVLNTAISLNQMAQPMQSILPRFSENNLDFFHSINIQGNDEVDRGIRLNESVNSWANKPFHITDDSALFRVVYYPGKENITLLFVFHHVICDFQTLENIFCDLLSLLNKKSENFIEKNNYFDTKKQSNYMRFIDYQLAYETSIHAAEDKNYWKKYFQKRCLLKSGKYRFPYVSYINTMRQSTRSLLPTEKYSAECLAFELSPVGAHGIIQLAKQFSCSPYAILLATLQIFIGLYFKESKVNIGTAVTLRQRSDFLSLSGYGVNPVAFIGDLDPLMTVDKLIYSTVQAVTKAVKHSRLNFIDALDSAGIDRELDRPEIFDIVFTYFSLTKKNYSLTSEILKQEDTKNSIEIESLQISPRKVKQRQNQFPLEFFMVEDERNLKGELIYRPSLLKDEIAEDLARGWCVFNENIVNNINTAIAHLPSLFQPQIVLELPDDFSQSFINAKNAATLHKLFEQRCVSCPEDIALTYNDSCWSYRSLNEHANQLARALTNRGIQRGHVVVVLADASAQVISLLLALSKLGVCFITAPREYPIDRIEFIAADSAAHCIIKDLKDNSICSVFVDTTAKFAKNSIRIFELSHIIDDMESYRSDNLMLDIDARDIAYYAYTSGSTGKPKGIVHSHANLVSFIQWQQQAFEIGRGDNIAQQASLGFDVAYCEIFGALCFGASLQLQARNDARDPAKLLHYINQNSITLIQLVPGFFRQISATYFQVDGGQSRTLNSVRHLLFVGEPLTADVVAQARKIFPNAKIYNVYGPTESVAACYYMIPAENVEGRVIPVGRPVTGRSISVVNEKGNQCDTNEIGEIVIGGPFLSSGYLNLSELNQRVFSTRAGERYYHSGDLGYRDEKGLLYVVGRKDNQVKINGVRVELEEVERIVQHCNNVKEACAFLDKLSEDDVRLSICLVFSDDSDDKAFIVHQIKQSLIKKLASFMLPIKYFSIDSLPRSVNGKIDRNAISTHPKLALINLPDINSEPITSEMTLYQMELVCAVKAVLKIEKVELQRNFFELGGNSLFAMQLNNYLMKYHSLDIGIENIFSAATIQDLVDEFEQRNRLTIRRDERRSREILNEVMALSHEHVEQRIREISGKLAL